MDRIRNVVYGIWYLAAFTMVGSWLHVVSRPVGRMAVWVLLVCWLVHRLPVFRRYELPGMRSTAIPRADLSGPNRNREPDDSCEPARDFEPAVTRQSRLA